MHKIMWTHLAGQCVIPQGITTRCYSTGDCTGPINKGYCQLFNRSTYNPNYCCFESVNVSRSNLNTLSFTLNDGGCRRCDGKAGSHSYVHSQ